MLPLFHVQVDQLIKNRKFFKLIGCAEARFRVSIFFYKKNVSLLFNEQSPIKKLKTKNVNNILFLFLIEPTTDR